MSEEFRTSQYIFDQIEDALSNVLQPIAQGGQTTTFKKYELRESVESNLKKIDDLTNTVGTFSVPNSTIGETVTTLWKDNSNDDGVSNTKKINKLMQTVGYEVKNNEIWEINDENSLIYKVNSLLGEKPSEGILSSIPAREGIKLNQDSYGFTNEAGYYTFEYAPVLSDTEYTISIPNGSLHVLWLLDNKRNSITDSASVLKDSNLTDFKTSSSTKYISLTIKKENDDFNVGNVIIQKKNIKKSLFGTVKKMSRLLSEKIASENSGYFNTAFLEDSRAQNTFLTDYVLNNSSIISDKSVYRLSEKKEGYFTLIKVKVEETSTYKIETEGKKARLVTIYYLDQNGDIISSENYSNNTQEDFYTKPKTAYISATFEGDSSDVEIYLYEQGGSSTSIKELIDQDVDIGATFSATSDSVNNTGTLDTNIKYQAIKAMDFSATNTDNHNAATRKSDLDSLYNFYLQNYEVVIAKSGYYLIAGQIGFKINNPLTTNPGEPVSIKGAIVLRNTGEIPHFGGDYGKKELHFNETYLAQAQSYQIISKSTNEYDYDKECNIIIAPKIVKLKQGDRISLKGKIQAKTDITAKINPDEFNTYLTILKLKNLPKKEYLVRLVPISSNGTWLTGGSTYTISLNTGETFNTNEFTAQVDAIATCEVENGKNYGKCKICITGNEDPYFIELGFKATEFYKIGTTGSEQSMGDYIILKNGNNAFSINAAPYRDGYKCTQITIVSPTGSETTISDSQTVEIKDNGYKIIYTYEQKISK